MSPSDERMWATLAHVFALAAFFVLGGLSLLGPLVVYLIYANRSAFVREHSVEALNFNITMLIAFTGLLVASVVLVLTIVGIVLLFVLIPLGIGLWIYWLVISIVAAIRANQGLPYRYPMSFRFVS